MAGTYKIGVELALNSNVVGAVEAMSRELRGLDRLVGDVTTKFERLATTIADLSRAGRSMSKLIENFEKLKTSTTGTMGSSLVTGLRDADTAMGTLLRESERVVVVMREQAKLAADIAKQNAAAARSTGNSHVPQAGPGRRSGGRGAHFDPLLAATEVQSGAHEASGFFVDSIEKAMGVDKMKSLLTQDDRMTPALMAEAEAKARAVSRLVPGSTTESNLELIREGMRNYGDPREAIESLEPFARAQMTQRLADVHGGGDGNSSRATDALFKSIEDLGLDIDRTDPKHPHVSPEKLENALRLLTRINIGTQGGVDAQGVLAFVKQARASGIAMSEQGLLNYVPIMQSMGASRSGTALSAEFQQLLVGTQTQAKFKEAQNLGVYDKSATWSHGHVNDAAHHLVDSQTAMSDPVGWFQRNVVPKLLASGQLTTAADGALAVSKFASTKTAQGLFAELAVAMAQISKQQETLRHTNTDPAQHAMDTDPAAKVMAFKSAENEFMVTMGKFLEGPALTVLASLTTALNAMSDWAQKNPETASRLTLLAAGLIAVSGAVATAYTTMLPFIGMMSAGGFLKGLLPKALPGAVPGGAPGAAPGVAAGEGIAGMAGGAIGATLLYFGLKGAWDAGRDPHWGEKQKAAEIAAAHQSAAEGRNIPQSAGFVPGDGFDAEGRPTSRARPIQVPPPPPVTVQTTNNIPITLDGKQIGNFVIATVAKALVGRSSSPGTGPVSDTRMLPSHPMDSR